MDIYIINYWYDNRINKCILLMGWKIVKKDLLGVLVLMREVKGKFFLI